MIIKSNHEEILWVDKNNMHGIKVVNKTFNNNVNARIENERILIDSINNTEFSYEFIQGGFPIRIDQYILT